VQEALEPLGRVTMRKMMGGATLYIDATIFANPDPRRGVAKVDSETNAVWDAEGWEKLA
jgi:DNA transformation protein